MRKNLRFGFIAALILSTSLASCSWAAETIKNLVPTCENKVYSLDAAYVAAGTAAHQYTSLPLCGSPKATAGKLCSQYPIVKTIQSAEGTADVAIKAAKKICNDSTFAAASEALDAFNKIQKIFSAKK